MADGHGGGVSVKGGWMRLGVWFGRLDFFVWIPRNFDYEKGFLLELGRILV